MTRDLSVASKVVEGHELGGGEIAESGSDLLGFVLLRGIFGGRGPRSASEVLGRVRVHGFCGPVGARRAPIMNPSTGVSNIAGLLSAGLR